MGAEILKATTTILKHDRIVIVFNLMQEKLLFLFAVIADTHIRQPDSSEESDYPSNRLSNDRTKYVVECLNKIKAEY